MKLSNVKITKGVDLFEQTNHQDLLQKAILFASSGIIKDTELQKNIFKLTENRGDYLAGNWQMMLEKIKELFSRQKIEVIGHQTKWLPVSFFRVYCPDVENAKVKIEFANTKSSEGDTSIEILGVGGGATFNIECTTSLEVEADNKNFDVVYEFESFWEHIRLTERNGTIREFCKLKDVNKNYKKTSTHVLENTQINLTDEQIDGVEEITLDKGTNGTKKLSIKSGSKLKVSNKLKLEQFGIEIGTEITTANQYDVNYEYVLPGGKTYKAIHPKNASYWLWTVK